MPLFSIVMPTRNRAHLLQFSLQSALLQTFDDYEIVVSDNHSMDKTNEVIRDIADKRVRYIRTEKPLSMADSWEFAFEHARGDYVTYLCDDDAIRPDLLERLYPILTSEPNISVGWMGGAYYHHDWPDENERYLLQLPRTTGNIQEIPSSSLLEKMFNLDYSVHFPRLLNSCCARAFLNERKQRMGKLFVPTCPDYSVAVAILTGMERILFIDEQLFIIGSSCSSNSSFGFRDSNSVQTFVSKYTDLERIWCIPLSTPTAFNHIAVTLLDLKEILVQELEPYSLSMSKLFIHDYEMIKLMELRGTDIRHMLERWNEALTTQSAEILKSVLEATQSTTYRLKRVIRRRFPTVARVLISVRNALTGQSVPKKRFDNILEAVKALKKISNRKGNIATL